MIAKSLEAHDEPPIAIDKDPRYAYYREEEKQIEPYFHCFEHHILNEHLRACMVDVMTHACLQMECHDQTLILAVSIVDRYFSAICGDSGLEKSQLVQVAVAALMIACKHEDGAQRVEEMISIIPCEAMCQDKTPVLIFEQDICHALEFRFSLPTVYHFLTKFLEISEASMMTCSLDRTAHNDLARCLCDRYLMDFSPHLPSLVAASIVWLTRAAHRHGLITCTSQLLHPWPAELQSVSGYAERDLRLCVQDIHAVLAEELRASVAYQLATTRALASATAAAAVSKFAPKKARKMEIAAVKCVAPLPPTRGMMCLAVRAKHGHEAYQLLVGTCTAASHSIDTDEMPVKC